MPSPRWSIIEYRGRDGLARIEQDWRRLFEEMPDPSLWHSFEVAEVYLESVCPKPESFRCLALSDGVTIRAIVPLEERQDRALGIPLRVWWPSLNEAFWIADVIGPEGDAGRALLPTMLRFLRQQRGRPALLSMGRMPEASAVWDGLEGIDPGEYCVYPDGSEFTIRCDRSFDELNASLSRNTRRYLTVNGRRFASLPDARFVRAVAPTDVAREFEAFLDVEASGWKGAAGSAVKQRPRRAAFYRALTTRLARDGRCEIHAMYVGEDCVAATFAVFAGRRCTAAKSGYDEAYSHVSPGVLLMHKTIEWCCADPQVDSLSQIADAPWHMRWRPDAVGVRGSCFRLRPLSGRMLILLMRFRYGPGRRLLRGLQARQDAAKSRQPA